MSATTPESEPVPSVEVRDYSVLHVEDNALDARLVFDLLRTPRDASFHVRRAIDLQQAENELGRRNFDVVLLDLELPGSSGLDTLQRLRRTANSLPVVVVTGLEETHDAIRTLQATGQPYLAKRDLTAERLSFVMLHAIRNQGREQYFMRLTDELRRARDDLDRLACIDPLTGLFNRRGLERVLESEQSRRKRGRSRLMAMLVDCDDFKHVNDSHGHAVGDAVLREVAARLKRCLRPTDHLARVGGDEFLVLVHEQRHGDSSQVAERLRSEVGLTSIPHSRADERVTISVGVAAVPDDARSCEELLLAADAALQRSKGSGKNQVSYRDDGEQRALKPRRPTTEQSGRKRPRASVANNGADDPQSLRARIAELEREVADQRRQLAQYREHERETAALRSTNPTHEPAPQRRDVRA